MQKTYTAVGLMSGTSLDGVDAVLLESDGAHTIKRHAAFYSPYTAPFKKQLMALARGDVPLSDVLRLERALTEQHVQTVEKLMAQPEAQNVGPIDVIGFHGQTIRHLPDEGLTWQLGDASYLSAKLNTPVVADFRRRDMALGGEGAPLASLYHQAVLQGQPLPAVVLNLGGVANITFMDESGTLRAGDVGPGCSLLDQWMQQKTGQDYDEGGAQALQGQVDQVWVANTLKQEGFFTKPLPKSADRYIFDHFMPPEETSVADGAATLCALTAACVVQAVKAIAPGKVNLWVTGGGAHNKGIVQFLQKEFATCQFFDDIGIPANTLEAECFAWLAIRRLKGLPTSVPQTTGVAEPTTGGVLTV